MGRSIPTTIITLNALRLQTVSSPSPSRSLALPWISEEFGRLVHAQNHTMSAGTAFAIAYEVRFRTLAVLFFDDGHMYIAVRDKQSDT